MEPVWRTKIQRREKRFEKCRKGKAKNLFLIKAFRELSEESRKEDIIWQFQLFIKSLKSKTLRQLPNLQLQHFLDRQLKPYTFPLSCTQRLACERAPGEGANLESNNLSNSHSVTLYKMILGYQTSQLISRESKIAIIKVIT